ncbi:fibronectin type III domain protein, partial [Ancylostoma duodenale]
VEYQKANHDAWIPFEKVISGQEGGVVVPRLLPNSDYRFRIRFIGDSSQSVWSSESDWMKTLPAQPSAAPLALAASPYDSTSLLLQWATPLREDWNANAIGYRVAFREYPIAAENDTWTTVEIPANSTWPERPQYLLHNLASFRHYILRMRAFNSEGSGPFSPPVFVYVGYSIPKRTFKMKVITAVISLCFFWRLIILVLLQEEFKKEVQSRTQQTFYPATNLEEGVMYFFAVWAETSAGRGTEVTGNVTLGPILGGPPAPTRPTLTPGPSSVTLEWKDEKRDGVTGHLIQAKLVSKEMNAAQQKKRHRRSFGRPTHIHGIWVTLRVVEGAGQQHEVSYRELEPSSFYVFRVFARNELGIGKPSAETEQLFVPGQS